MLLSSKLIHCLERVTTKCLVPVIAFPVLPNLSDQLLSSLRNADKSIVKTHYGPTLDIHTLEGPIVPELMEQTTPPSYLPTTTTTTVPTTTSNHLDETQPMTSLLDFPLFHSFHISHRGGRRPAPTRSRTAVEPDPSTLQRLETLEEIRFDRQTSSQATAPTSTTSFPEEEATPTSRWPVTSAASSSVHPLAASRASSGFSFQPEETRVIMTHRELISTIKDLMRRQQDDIDIEKEFLNSLLQ